VGRVESYGAVTLPTVLIHRSAERDCPKSLGGACNVALRATETVLFGSFWPPCTGQIHDRNVTRTPFRTVSEEEFSEVGIAPVQHEGIPGLSDQGYWEG
jgi:hypothetical protein